MQLDLRRLAPYIAGISAFFVVFNLFYTTTPYPFAVVTAEDITKFAPNAYVASGDEPERIVATSSMWRGYKVMEYWYYWPYDGHVKKDDWEPIIVLVDGDSIKAVAHRIHYNWRVSYAFPTEDGKPVVSFMYLWHTPMLKVESGYRKVTIIPEIGEPPEDVNYNEVFGYGLLPTESALTAALTYGFAAAVITTVVFRNLFRV